MSPDPLISLLPLPQRLALSYAPTSARSAILGLLVLDQRLAGIVGLGGEVMITQIKLAWWRERLSEAPDNWPSGEPLLDHLRAFDGDLARLVPLVDGYESLLAETFDRMVLTTFLRGKMQSWAAVSDAGRVTQANAPVEQAARELALFELEGRLTAESEIAVVRAMAADEPWQPPKLARPLRPLAVLHALTRRARRKGQRDLLHGPAAMGLAMRVGLLGR